MTLFNVNNPFVQAASISYMLRYLLQTAVFYPILFWGCYRSVAKRSVPIIFYFILGIIFPFWQPNLFFNDLIITVLAVLAVYLSANPSDQPLATIVSQFGVSMLVYYFSSAICLFTSQVIISQAPQLRGFIFLWMVLIIYGIAWTTIKLIHPLIDHYFQRVNDMHPVAEWWFSILFIPLSGFFYFVQFNIQDWAKFTHTNVVTGNALALFIALLYFIAALGLLHFVGKHLYYRDLTEFQTQEISNLENYAADLEVMYDDLRRFRHDYKNILYSLKSALDSNNLDYARRSLNQLTNSTSDVINMPTHIIGSLKNLTDSGIKSITYAKINQAMDKGLHPQLEVAAPIDLTSTLNRLDAVRIISILLDNAITAASQSRDKKLDISIFENDNAQFIVVGNSTRQKQVNFSHLAKYEHAVTFGSNAHLGLRNLQIILGHYPNAANDRRSDNYWFEQRIVIPKSEQ